MAKKKALFWIVPGVVEIDKKDYGAEMPLPVDKIDKKVLDRWIKNGKVGEKVEAVPAFCESCANLKNDNATLVKKVEANKQAGGVTKKLETAEGQVTELTGKLETAEGKVSELDLDVQEKAALIEKQGKKIAKLKEKVAK